MIMYPLLTPCMFREGCKPSRVIVVMNLPAPVHRPLTLITVTDVYSEGSYTLSYRNLMPSEVAWYTGVKYGEVGNIMLYHDKKSEKASKAVYNTNHVVYNKGSRKIEFAVDAEQASEVMTNIPMLIRIIGQAIGL
ncbi:hypothetical protein GR28A_00108 [Vibrio phage vB_VcorM_GR28A]|nr:hypothetical protein GR28A_00108 [Vibrio phage vB_VcorM_GR28A]